MSSEPSDELTALECQGLAWVDRLTSGDATEGDLAALRLWRSQSSAHAEAFAAAVRMQRSVQAWRQALSPSVVLPRSPTRPSGPSRRAILGGGAVAASIAAWGMLRPPLDLWPSLQELRADYRTGKGDRRQVALGRTRVELNTQTAVAVIDDGLRLIEGEASVEASAGVPFRIVASAGVIRMRGGRLNVRCLDSTVSVACLSGVAQVTHRRGGIAALQTGDLVRYSASGLDTVERFNIQSVEAWRKGLLLFRDAPLSEVIAEVNRYRPGRIILGDAEAAQRRFNGAFRTDRMDDVIAQIRAVTGGAQTNLPGGVIVLS